MIRPRLAAACVLAFPLVPQEPPRKPQTLDSSKRQAIEKLAEEWFSARPATALEDFDPNKRAKLVERAKALDPIPASSEKEIRALLWKSARKHGARLDPKSPMQTKWGRAAYSVANAPGGDAPKMGLLIGLHGGGPGAGDKSEAQGVWSAPLAKQNLVGIFPQAIQLVHDAWDTPEGERFVVSLVEMAKRTYDIDPDRVMVAGFSMGGTGSWFHAGRHPHLYAAAFPFSGVIFPDRRDGKVHAIHHGLVPNVRHVPLYYTAGADDTQCPPDTYVFAEEMLAKLRADHDGYETHFQLAPKVAHAFPAGEPQGAFEFMTNKKRRTFPKTLTWEVSASPLPDGDGRLVSRDFYWLRFESPADFQRTEAKIEGQEVHVTVTKKEPPLGLTIYLSPELLDVTKEVTVFVNDIVKFRGVLEPSFSAILESMSARLDRSMVFDRRIEVP